MAHDDVPASVESNASFSSKEIQNTKATSGQNGSNAKYTRQGNPALGRLTGREQEFQELGDLTALYDGLATKTRQHVNPLADHFQVPTPPPNWAELFADPTLPLQIDVGCGSGRFVLIRARRMCGGSCSEDTDTEVDAAADELLSEHTPGSADCAPSTSSTKPIVNVLGLEIRQKLVERAQAWADRLHLRNCRFIFTNATVSFKSLFSSYPGPIELVSMQFPDPHFKTRHRKRRHVQPQLVQEMGELLPPGSRVFLQGDVPEAVRWMRDMLELHGGGRFSLAPECRGSPELIMRDEWETAAPVSVEEEEEEEVDVDNGAAVQPVLMAADTADSPPTQTAAPRQTSWSSSQDAGWLRVNPLGVPTEREVYVGQIKAPVYRVMLLRNNNNQS